MSRWACRGAPISMNNRRASSSSRRRAAASPASCASSANATRMNGSFALGVAARAIRLLGPGPLDAALDDCRAALDAAPPETLPAARAAASAFAMRAATTLTVASGAGSVLRDHHAQRLVREAMFLLVFGSRPQIKSALLALVSAPPSPGHS